MHQDIIEIEQLLYRCCHAVDQGLIDEIIDLFHPDATLMIKWEENGVYRGHDAIRGWFESYIQNVVSSMRYLHHKITSPMIKVDGKEAVSNSYLNVDAALKDTGEVIVTIGHYNDKLVRMEGRWCFKERAIFIDNSYTK